MLIENAGSLAQSSNTSTESRNIIWKSLEKGNIFKINLILFYFLQSSSFDIVLLLHFPSLQGQIIPTNAPALALLHIAKEGNVISCSPDLCYICLISHSSPGVILCKLLVLVVQVTLV